jgi:hypothetical protein
LMAYPWKVDRPIDTQMLTWPVVTKCKEVDISWERPQWHQAFSHN